MEYKLIYRIEKERLLEALRDIRVLVFDLDGTLTKIESIWRYLHEKFGVWDKAKKHKEMFFRGEINYEEWAKLDAELWKGRTIEEFEEAIMQVPLMDQAKEVLRALSEKYKIFIVSSGLDILKARFGDVKIQHFIGNKLIFEDGIFTGKVEVKIKFDNKSEVLEKLLKKHSHSFKQVASIGDADNDYNMLKKSRIAISINPKSNRIKEISHIVIEGKSLKPLKEIFLNP